LTAVDWGAAAQAVSGHEALYAALVVLLGYVTLGLSGFGSALVIVPLLGWHSPLTLVVPLVLMIDVPASLLHAGLNLRQVAWGEIPRLVPAMVAGSLLGAALLAWATSAWPLLVLGLYVAAVGLRGLRSLRPARVPPPFAPAAPDRAWLAGLGIGVIESLFGVAGPVVVAWLSRRLNDPLALRATVPPTIVIVALLAIGAAAVAGQLGQRLVWVAWLALLPVGLLGVALGHRIAGRLPARRVGVVVFTLLIASGLAMVGRSLLALAR
jgi:hypothetical protein